MELKGTHQILVYANVNLLGKTLRPIKESTEALLGSSNKAGIEVNAEKTKCIFMSHHQTAGQNYNRNTDDKYF
jgi:hypothetical protein